MEETEALKLLSVYLRYSLLDYDEAADRYHLHDLLAEYACLQMVENEEVAARISHASYYANVLFSIDQMYHQGGKNILPALCQYDTEWPNMEAGRVASALYLEEDQEAAQACNRYAWQGAINALRLKPKDRVKWLEDGLRAARVLGNREAEAAHLGNLGLAYADLGETRKAIEHHEGHLKIAREIGDRQGEGAALGNLGLALYDLEEKDRAVDLVKQALAIFEAIESPYAVSARNTLREWGVLPKGDDSQKASS